MTVDVSEQYVPPSTVTTFRRRVPNEQKGLQEFEIDLEGNRRQYMRSIFARCRPRKSIDRQQINDMVTNVCLFSTIFIVPNAAAIAMGYIYVFAQLNPTSQISASLHDTRTSWLVFQIFLPLICISAAVANLLLLLATIKYLGRSIFLMFLAMIVAFTPIWCPYVVEAALRKNLWNHVCDGFDANILMDAVNYNSAGFSSAQFPSTMMGGGKWQIYQDVQGVYDFGPVGQTSKFTYDFRNETYTIHDSIDPAESGHLTDDQSPLSFPEFGLSSDGTWVRSCSTPAVNLQNATGNIVVKTGLGAYTDCSVMEVCAMTSGNLDGILLALGRILIALEQASQCCTRTKWG